MPKMSKNAPEERALRQPQRRGEESSALDVSLADPSHSAGRASERAIVSMSARAGNGATTRAVQRNLDDPIYGKTPASVGEDLYGKTPASVGEDLYGRTPASVGQDLYGRTPVSGAGHDGSSTTPSGRKKWTSGSPFEVSRLWRSGKKHDTSMRIGERGPAGSWSGAIPEAFNKNFRLGVFNVERRSKMSDHRRPAPVPLPPRPAPTLSPEDERRIALRNAPAPGFERANEPIHGSKADVDMPWWWRLMHRR